MITSNKEEESKMIGAEMVLMVENLKINLNSAYAASGGSNVWLGPGDAASEYSAEYSHNTSLISRNVSDILWHL